MVGRGEGWGMEIFWGNEVKFEKWKFGVVERNNHKGLKPSKKSLKTKSKIKLQNFLKIR